MLLPAKTCHVCFFSYYVREMWKTVCVVLQPDGGNARRRKEKARTLAAVEVLVEEQDEAVDFVLVAFFDFLVDELIQLLGCQLRRRRRRSRRLRRRHLLDDDLARRPAPNSNFFPGGAGRSGAGRGGNSSFLPSFLFERD
mmetsp:Transcript_11842/g.39006  ORF Transcript_11842/g.39006 Transcript_11842/m.39006 type:complete len:140 (-) Transcript_11842:544-963(-)